MELTGKCKEEFERFYDNYYDEDVPAGVESFYKMAHSMKWGVYVDFFDSVGVYVNIGVWFLGGLHFSYDIRACEGAIYSSKDGICTRAEARTKAIEKANEIYEKIYEK